ncbi:MAG: dihydrofolate reductase family protein, partial [Cyanobacteriota bacterium]
RALPFFQQPLERWLVAPAPVAAEAEALGFTRGVAMGGWPAALLQLSGLGVQRLAVLGGAALEGALLADRLLDALQFTVCPRLLGGPHTWVPAGLPLEPSLWELREQRRLEGGELLLRYGAGPSGPAG